MLNRYSIKRGLLLGLVISIIMIITPSFSFAKGTDADNAIDNSNIDLITMSTVASIRSSNRNKLKEELENGATTICLKNGIYPIHDFEISEDTKIIGQSSERTIIDAEHQRLFLVDEGVNFELEDITIINGENQKGGAIHNNGNLVLKNIVFDKNRAPGENSAGGAIYNNGEVLLSNCVFKNNISNMIGGAIYNKGTLTIASTKFERNVADDCGGAIYNNGQAIINTTVFEYNITSDLGGAIFNSNNGDLDVVLSSFVGNIALGYSGAIHSDSTKAEIHYSRLVNNTTGSLSGTIDARNNWWGHNKGPYAPIELGIRVEPWLIVDIELTPLPSGEILASAGFKGDSNGGNDPIIASMSHLGIYKDMSPVIYSADAINDGMYPHSTELFYPKNDSMTINYKIDEDIISRKINIEGK